MSQLKHPLIWILVIHCSLGLGFGVTTPVFEAPDEANHFLFVRYLQTFRQLPIQTLDQNGPRAHHPPLYFILGAALTAWIPGLEQPPQLQLPHNGALWFRYGDPDNTRKSKFIHSTEERWPWQGEVLAVHVLRAFSTVFSTVAVYFTYALSRVVFPDTRPVATLAAALLAFNPMVLFMAGTVQNSTAALATSALVLYQLTHYLQIGFTPRRWLMIGILFAVAALVQTSGLALAVPVGLAWALEVVPTRNWRRGLEHGLTFALPVLIGTGWWFWRNWALYGDWKANSIVGALWANQPIMPFEQTIYLLTTGMVGRFGYGLIIEYPDVIYRLFLAVAGVALLGLVRNVSLNTAPQSILNLSSKFWLIHFSAIVAVSIALAYYIFTFIRGGHGRYLFTAYPSLALFLAAGALYWFPVRRQQLVLLSLSGLCLALSAHGLFNLVLPAYAPPRAPTATDSERQTPVEANIGDTARVLGYWVNHPQIQPGQALEVTVIWEPLSQTDVPYTVFAQLIHPEVGLLAQSDIYPGRGNWATTIWEVGRPFVDSYHLTLPPDAPPTDAAQIVLGLYNAQTGERLWVTGANAGTSAEAWVRLGLMRIRP